MSRRPGDRASLMTSEEIERARLEIDRERLELEKTKADLARSFLARHSAILIPAAVSLAAVIVSLGQVWVTQIQKNKELEVIVVQKRLKLEMQDAQRKRELDISAARFVTDNRQAIFLGTPEEQELLARLISTLFPIEVSTPLLRRLERASPAAGSKHGRRESRHRPGPPQRLAEMASVSSRSSRIVFRSGMPKLAACSPL